MSESQIKRIVTATKMYYEENLTQQEIAKKLQISRPLVSILLAQARELNIVEIRIRDPYVSNEEVLNLIKMRFNVDDGIVVPKIADESRHYENLVKHIVHFLKNNMQTLQCVGIGWGDLIERVTDAYPKQKNVSESSVICPIVGNLNMSIRAFHSNELVRCLANKVGSSAQYLSAPALPMTLREQELFMETENYQQILSTWAKLDMVIVAPSAYPTAPDLASAYRLQSKQNIKEVVGEMLTYYYDREGNIVTSDHDFAIRIPLELLRKVDKRVLIVPPNINADAVYGALLTKLFNIIIIDEYLANILMHISGNSSLNSYS